MQHKLVLNAITQGIVGLILLTILVVMILVIWNELRAKRPLNGIVLFAAGLLGFWCLLAFADAYVSLRQIFLSQAVSAELDISQHSPYRVKTVVPSTVHLIVLRKGLA
jgi:hypothetical protein